MSATVDFLRGQWSNPADIFTILLIIGGDVVRVAIAQLCAGPVPNLTPVSFSFGWVIFSVLARLTMLLIVIVGHVRCVGFAFGCWREQAHTEAGTRLYSN